MNNCNLPFAIFSVLALSACVPFPNVRQLAPEISGTLLRGEEPANGLFVRQCVNYDAEKRTCIQYAEGVSDLEGRFVLSGAKRLTAFASLLGDPIYAHGIMVAVDGQQLEWSYGSVGYMPSKVVLQCSVATKLTCTHTP